MESYKCPLTRKIFEDPVISDDGYTYERKAIEDYIKQHGISPKTKQPISIDTLKTNHTLKIIIDELIPLSSHPQYNYQLNIDIKKPETRPVFQGFGKSIFKAEWINREGPSIILLKIDGAKAKQEASFYVQLSCHPHIVRTFGFVPTNRHSVMLLQECAPEGDLSELLREEVFKPNERVLWKIFEQICDAMICLADNGIVHGDLACRNVLVFKSDPNNPKKNLVKLTDFGLTRGSKLYSVVSTPARTVMTIIPTRYAAPEILQNTNSLNYTEKSDVYSMGVLMWEACSYGELPYSCLDDDDGVEQLKLIGGKLSQPSLCSTELWKIMNECWDQEPQNRPDFQSLKESILTLQFQQIPK
jgi:serine/threonine protein kinase